MGVFQTLHYKGPLDKATDGIALETLVLQEVIAQNHYKSLEYEIFYWHTQNHQYEVDFVLYGKRGLKAVEVKLTSRLRDSHFKGLIEFKRITRKQNLCYFIQVKRVMFLGIFMWFLLKHF